MARLTSLPLAEARELLAAYGIDLAELEPLEAGSVNSNFRLRGADGSRFFARIYEEQDAAGAERELRMLRSLKERGLPVAVALPSPPGGLPAFRGKPFAVYPWVDGEILCQARVTPAHARAVGRALAELHGATDAVGDIPPGRFEVADLHDRLDRIDAESAEYREATAFIRSRLSHYDSRRRSGLPGGIIHGDLFRDNVLFDGDRIVALLDFESASAGCFVFDLAVVLFAWCYGDRFDPDLVAAVVQGYQAVRPLGAEERSGLVVEGAIAALRFATTRITDFSLRAPPGEPPKRSYQRFLDRLAAVEAGAFDAALSAPA